MINRNVTQILRCVLAWFLVSISTSWAQETLTVRSGDHPSYSRVVFDWERNVGYVADLNGQALDITFIANAIPDFSAVRRDQPAYLSNPRFEEENGNLKVSFDAANGGEVRHFRSGTKIVVDLIVNEDGQQIVTDSADSTPVVSAPPVAATPQAVPVAEVVSAPVVNSGGDVRLRASETDNAFTIDYLWDEDVKAAAFVRAGTLWVVFDKFTTINHQGVESSFGGRVKSGEQLSNLSPTILNYEVEPNQTARMVKTPGGWQLSLRTGRAVPQLPIQVGHQTVSEVGENIFLMAEDLGNVINIEDPKVGDNLTIVTASESSQGVMDQSNYTEFNILKSAQGIALQLIADDIFVTRHNNGVSISGQNGLAVSRSSVPSSMQASSGIGVNISDDGEQKFLDFSGWAEGPLPGQGYTKNRHELLYQLSRSTEEDRNEARWNLATFDLAHNNAAESLGILELMGESEPAFIENPSYRALLAVSNIKLRRFDEAIELLSHKSLVAELDARLWRSLAYEAKGEYQKAMEDFNVGLDVLSLQTPDHRAAFQFASLRASNALGDVEFMNAIVNNMNNLPLNAKQLTELDYWRGKMAEQSGDEVQAAELYDSVIKTGVRYPAAMAKFARVNQQLRMQDIEGGQAIDELEKLRFSWRGDDFELELLKQLGQLYVEQLDYREGLSTLRQAATYFPRSSRTAGLTRTMSEIYNDLYLNGGADNMPPLKAMALFMEFRELTPLGADGDTMSRNLASRMVTVDLLNDAAELLEFQVENRLQGVARASIASDLAKIYVMNKEANRALQILRATRNSQVPEDIEQERRMIEIRALVELGQYEEAEVMLEGINGDIADSLRADIYWNTEDWMRVVSLGNQKLGQRWQDSEELNESERQTVLRMAVAMALDNNDNGLENLRNQYIAHMENGLFADAFEIITAKEQKTGADIRQLTQTIASVDRLETFMDSYRDEFALRATNIN